MEIDYFQYKKRSKKEEEKILQRERIPHLTDRAEATKTIHIIQLHLNLSVYHSTSNSYHKMAQKPKNTKTFLAIYTEQSRRLSRNNHMFKTVKLLKHRTEHPETTIPF